MYCNIHALNRKRKYRATTRDSKSQFKINLTSIVVYVVTIPSRRTAAVVFNIKLQ